MKVGVHLPQWGHSASRSGVLDVACAAEAAGLDSVWVADHVAYPINSTSVYPYRGSGTPFGPEDGFLEAFTTLAVAAGATNRVSLGTSVLVLPMREPLLAAKTMASLDVLSGGRTLFALGAGWWAEEFAAVGAPFAGRGRRFDEQLTILGLAWSKGVFSFHGEEFDFDELACLPLPSQTSGPPLLIGGLGSRSWQRAGRFGAGWHAVGADTDLLARGRAEMQRVAKGYGRDASNLMVTTSCGLGRSEQRAVERLGGLARVGVDHVVVNFAGAVAAPEICAGIDWLADRVLPRLRAEMNA